MQGFLMKQEKVRKPEAPSNSCLLSAPIHETSSSAGAGTALLHYESPLWQKAKTQEQDRIDQFLTTLPSTGRVFFALFGFPPLPYRSVKPKVVIHNGGGPLYGRPGH
jgi:hypothetical protein